MADWAEVRRLAADFQRLQASSSVYKLSERNCVELVATLVKRGFLEILYTLDGKEYMTPGQLDREVKDELVAHGGNICMPQKSHESLGMVLQCLLLETHLYQLVRNFITSVFFVHQGFIYGRRYGVFAPYLLRSCVSPL